MEKQTIKTMSIDAEIILGVLVDVKVGETITYEDLSKRIGRDVQGQAYSAMATARRAAMRTEQVVFGTIQNEGLVRLSDEQILALDKDGYRSIRRAALRRMKRRACVKFDGLTDENQIKHNAGMSIDNAIRAIGTKANVKKIEARVAESKEKLPLAKTLEAFKSES